MSGPATQYQVWLSYPQGGYPALGSVTVGGTPILLDQPVQIANPSSATYTGSAIAGTDKVYLRAYNGSWTDWAEADLTDAGSTPPVITPHNQTVANNQSVSLASIFTVSGPATQYQVWFSYPQGGSPALGSVTVNGTAIPLDQPVQVASPDSATYRGSATAGTDKLYLRAYNGSWTDWAEADMTDLGGSADTAPNTANPAGTLLLSNYMASAFATPAGGDGGASVATPDLSLTTTLVLSHGTADNRA